MGLKHLLRGRITEVDQKPQEEIGGFGVENEIRIIFEPVTFESGDHLRKKLAPDFGIKMVKALEISKGIRGTLLIKGDQINSDRDKKVKKVRPITKR